MKSSGKKHPFWQDVPIKVRYPQLRGDPAYDAVVVGAGITGLTAALLLKQAGMKVAVIEMLQVAGGASGHTSAHLTACLDRSFETLISRFGEDGARRAAQGSLEAIARIEGNVRELGIDCDFARVPGYRFTERAEDVEPLRQEAERARLLGLEASWIDDVPLPFPARGAVRFENQARFHPVRYLDALAAEVDGDGSAVFEHTRVEDIEDGPPCRVKAGGFTLTAGAVILATHTPINLVLSIHTRVAPYMSYLLGIRPLDDMPDALFWDTAEPYHYWRRCQDERGPLVLVGGNDHKTGQEDDPETRFKALFQYAKDRISVESVDFYWSHEVFEPADGLPYIGRRGGKDNIYLATGFSGTGLTFGTLAGMILSDLIRGRENAYAELFSPHRVKPVAMAKDFVKENFNFACRLVGDRLKPSEGSGLEPIQPGEGRILTVNGHKRAVYCDEAMGVHILSPVCTHAGCIVHWNGAEKTWDCPCHGARYSPTGEVIAGPATRNLGEETPGPVTQPEERFRGTGS